WVYCWGEGQYGRLGNGAETDVLVPKAIVRGEIPNDVTITDIDAGDLFMCSIGSDKKAYCWGDGFRGQLGDGDTDDEFTPVAALNGEIPAGEGLLDITAGSYHTCAVATNHWAYCWGYGAGGRLGNNSSTQRATPVAIVNG